VTQARQAVLRSIDTEMVRAYWLIGRDIVRDEQNGQMRADYGKALIKAVSIRLTTEFGRGFSEANLRNMRQFFIEFQPVSDYPIRYTVSSELGAPQFNPKLGWSHYTCLMRIPRLEARAFYEIEAAQNCWSVRELERQIESLLYDRLAKSKNKETIMKLIYEGQEIAQPQDAFKDPFVLEFLDLPESHQLIESKFEEALINNLQQFLLELGKGFAFIARQKRLSFDGNHFYADLVFYHVILKCYVIVDLKTKTLSHGDLGQIQLYVNYFDREIKMDNDNPTIGLILCTEKSDSMVQYQLGDMAKQIFASKYQFHLPTEKELENQLIRELRLLKTE
jgi:predicted nuclease of restriction endonuclease-like (RecB) superfamily